MFLRPPVSAGTYYEIEPEMLRKQLNFYFGHSALKGRKQDALVRIVPHSPYIHSGITMAHSYVNLNKSNFVILGSNHSLYGADFALMKNSLWKTPIGEAIVDNPAADKLLKECGLIEIDVIPHEDESSIEVQLPFLLHKFGDVKMVPILVNNQAPDETLLENCETVGRAIAKLIKREENWKLIGSSDMTRSMTKEGTEKTDKRLLKSIVKLDAKGMFNAIGKTNASVCGYGVIAASIFAAKELGAKKGEVLKYSTSVDAGDAAGITGYASLIFY